MAQAVLIRSYFRAKFGQLMDGLVVDRQVHMGRKPCLSDKPKSPF